MPSAVNPWTSTTGSPWPHTATPTRCSSSSTISCRASRGTTTSGSPSAGGAPRTGPTTGSATVSGPSLGTSGTVAGTGLVTPSGDAEDATGLVAVPVHLLDQRLDRVELRLAPEPGHEAHPGRL